MNLLSRVIQYARDIVEGKILACKKHIQACQRFLNDFERMQNNDSPYEFDEDELYRFYKWANMFKHTKGVLAGQRIELTDFQLFVVGNLFGWKDKETGTRRFRKAYIQLARKNAKSQLLALITSYTCFLSDEQEECYIAGWGREQSSIVYNEILSQIRACELLKGKYKDSYGRITHIRSGSVIQPLSKEARKTGDGKHPSVAVIDEFHVHETSEIYDVMISGMVGRENPLIVIITTAGFDMSRPCYTEYLYTSKILDPSNPIENDEYFVMICELDTDDDIKDERNWIKANPIVATYEEGMAFLRSELKAALDVPEKMRNFLTKNMNRWVDQKENGYMALSAWNACGVDTLPDLVGKTCYVGIDLSSSVDLTSVSFEFPLKDGTYVVFNHSFMPEDTLKARMHTDKVRYDLWVEQGWITVTPGAVVDYRFIMQYIKDHAELEKWIIKEICYDPWSATMLAQEMDAEGFTMVEIRQGIKTLSAATKSIRELTLQRKIIHDKNPVLTWAISNAVVRQDHNENIMLDKDKSTNRIDPIASLINAHVRAMLNEDTTSVYENRGIITF
ncbi:terminase large subunit [Lihuaxuella thermophila]|uniref:Phage terminase-like protein, large subunit, contains N-terminal HTH domain n=1 Tax=Lihuaxuella thermophila TaxID=1173111 RepID=A0A1H8JGW6_9BACL|nr:terminase TerL endonuclease subunit [Lihuaxuella thermophila]SEN80034.1 Phage terminase-like protein, large subunit, contains N-terminal HTH domain [Lihuaxuella thermophila]